MTILLYGGALDGAELTVLVEPAAASAQLPAILYIGHRREIPIARRKTERPTPQTAKHIYARRGTSATYYHQESHS